MYQLPYRSNVCRHYRCMTMHNCRHSWVTPINPESTVRAFSSPHGDDAGGGWGRGRSSRRSWSPWRLRSRCGNWQPPARVSPCTWHGYLRLAGSISRSGWEETRGPPPLLLQCGPLFVTCKFHGEVTEPAVRARQVSVEKIRIDFGKNEKKNSFEIAGSICPGKVSMSFGSLPSVLPFNGQVRFFFVYMFTWRFPFLSFNCAETVGVPILYRSHVFENVSWTFGEFLKFTKYVL